MFFEAIKRYFHNNTPPKETSEILKTIRKGEIEDEIKDGMDRLWGKEKPENQLEEAPDGKEMLENFHMKHMGQKPVYSDRQPFLPLRPFLKVAAIIFIVVGIGAYFYVNQYTGAKNDQIGKNDIRFLNKAIPFGQKLTIKLSDGSTVKINSGSTLKYPESFKHDRREVYLEGEAFFEVQRDENRPFIVHSKKLETIVLGTSFNIRAYKEDEKVEVAVVTGKVKVKRESTDNDSEVVLLPSEMVIVDKLEMEKIEFTPEKVISWKDNIIHFEKASFEEVTKILERWYGVTFIMETGGVKGRFEGSFQNLSLEEVLKGLNYTTKFDFKIEGDIVRIY